jgi:hypothetical protein
VGCLAASGAAAAAPWRRVRRLSVKTPPRNYWKWASKTSPQNFTQILPKCCLLSM